MSTHHTAATESDHNCENGTNKRLFVGVCATGIIYADRTIEDPETRDYKRLANLFFDTLELSIQPDCPGELAEYIKQDAAGIQRLRGQIFQTSDRGGKTLLGYKTLTPKEQNEAWRAAYSKHAPKATT